MKIKPLHGNVVVEKSESSEQIQGGIIIPDLGKEVGTLGTVIAVGPGWVTISGDIIKPTVKEGEKVYYPSFGGQKVMMDSRELLVFKDTDLLVVIED